MYVSPTRPQRSEKRDDVPSAYPVFLQTDAGFQSTYLQHTKRSNGSVVARRHYSTRAPLFNTSAAVVFSANNNRQDCYFLCRRPIVEMENRMKNTFVLLALVLALAHCNRADDPQVPVAAVPSPTANTVTEGATTQNPVVPSKESTTTDAASIAINTTKPVQLEVFYEALCSDSVNFVDKQLSPVYDKLNKFLNVTFIPFGQGKITKEPNGTYSLACNREHECEADRVHACGIKHIKDADQLLKFVNCLLVEGYNNEHFPDEKCFNVSKLDTSIVSLIKACIANNNESNILLENYMKVSLANQVKSVPKIVFNKIYSETTEILALTNLMQAVCTFIPSADSPTECKNIVSGSSTVVVGILPLLISVYYFIRMF